MKILPIFRSKNTRLNSLARIVNGSLGWKSEMMKKYRDHQRLIIIMKKLQLSGFKCKIDKYKFAVPKVEYLG